MRDMRINDMNDAFPILYEDRSFLAISKPSGIVVNRAESVKDPTVQDWIMRRHPEIIHEQNQEFRSRFGIVHRIDKETSGILLIAKTPSAFVSLKQQFMDRDIQKVYFAIIHGQMPSREGVIEAPVDRLPWNKERFGIVPGGKSAVTAYRVLESYGSYQLIACYPKTGRTHQIRVHLKYLNRPILGDYLYAGRKTARNDRSWVPRVMLHASKLSFLHPESREQISLEAPMPDDMRNVLNRISSELAGRIP